MRFPLVVRTRATEEYRRRYTDARVECAERVAKDQATIIAQNCEVQESQRRHIDDLQAQIESDSAANRSLVALTEQLVKRNDALRREYAGDLQLAHSRYDEFVRDMLEKLMTRAAPAAAARSSSLQAQPLPDAIQSAIEEFSFGNPILEEQLTREAWRRMSKDEKPDEIAEKIRRGETPE